MPQYCFRRGEDVVTRSFPIGRAPRAIRVQGRRYTRDLVAEHRDFRDCPGASVVVSDALGVLPSQVREFQEWYGRRGVKTEFNAQGQMVFRSRGNRNAVLKATGWRDNDAGYGDYAGR
jgi:hypothetical protein